MIIRNEEAKHYEDVYKINASAFSTEAEARLINELRQVVKQHISLVAEEDGLIVGHILFTPVSLSGHPELRLMGLGPVAVLPEQQGKGIGSALIRHGLERCQGAGFGACVVLGHKDYYPRFGFIPSIKYNIKCEYDVPPEVFMIAELQPGYLEGASGTIQYHPAFNAV